MTSTRASVPIDAPTPAITMDRAAFALREVRVVTFVDPMDPAREPSHPPRRFAMDLARRISMP